MLQAFGFQEFSFRGQFVQAEFQFLFDADDGLVEGRSGGDVVAVGVDADFAEFGGAVAGQRVELVDGFDFVAEQGDPPCAVFVVAGEDVDVVAAQAEGAALEGGVVAFVL